MRKDRHRFFCPNPESGFLNEEESKHAARVLRLNQGDEIELLDGKGNWYVAIITSNSKNALGFEIISVENTPFAEFEVHLAVAPTKNIDRFEFMIEKCAEIGVLSITPLLCQKSERKEVKTEKLTKQLVSAIKQSGHRWLPELAEMTPFKQYVSQTFSKDTGLFIAHCEKDNQKQELKNLLKGFKKIVILIGPEGDFSSDEITLAKAAGFNPVSLGSSRLRTETAGIVACHTVNLILSS